ncbi:MAG TPA: hypothetical protein VGK90_00950, partial [Rhizomicrobium sp.]
MPISNPLRLLSHFAAALAISSLCAAAPAPTNQPPPAGSFVAVKDGRIWYQSCGVGSKAIVLIHDGVLHSAA